MSDWISGVRQNDPEIVMAYHSRKSSNAFIALKCQTNNSQTTVVTLTKLTKRFRYVESWLIFINYLHEKNNKNTTDFQISWKLVRSVDKHAFYLKGGFGQVLQVWPSLEVKKCDRILNLVLSAVIKRLSEWGHWEIIFYQHPFVIVVDHRGNLSLLQHNLRYPNCEEEESEEQH